MISTLQDLSFVVDKADLELGTVSATKLSGYQLRMTVTVRPRGTNQMLVRANAQYMDKAVEDPKPYQDFFTALEKSMFLTAHQVDLARSPVLWQEAGPKCPASTLLIR